MRYQPPEPDNGGGFGPAEMILGFVICLFILGYLVSVFIGGIR
jgi:hypothetical protein